MKEFNSQVCTTKEQSQRLLDLGLKPETADMHHTNASLPYNKDEFHSVCLPPPAPLNKNDKAIPQIDSFVFIPAWSLHRLMKLNSFSIMEGGVTVLSYDNTYDDVIEDIEWSIKKGYFNKEYLKQ